MRRRKLDQQDILTKIEALRAKRRSSLATLFEPCVHWIQKLQPEEGVRIMMSVSSFCMIETGATEKEIAAFWTNDDPVSLTPLEKAVMYSLLAHYEASRYREYSGEASPS